MNALPYEIVLYLSSDGSCPFESWLKALRDRQARARIRKRLDRIRLGNLGDVKPVGDGVMELRLNYGPGYRVYFSYLGSRIVLLLCGGDKKTQNKDILKAKQYWIDFQSRENANS